MFKLEQISTANLRGITLPTPISLKRITLLVGKNSAGKSTFARIFPLLRQSIQTLRKSPVLWFGHFVDFGSFDDACNRNHPNKPIQFQFLMRTMSSPGQSSVSNRARMADPRRLRIADGTQVAVAISIAKVEDGTYLSHTSVTIGDREVQIFAEPTGAVTLLKSGGHDWKPGTSSECYSIEGHLLPHLFFLQKTNVEGQAPEFDIIEQPFFDLVKRALQPILHGNTRDPTFRSIANNLPISSFDNLYDALLKDLTRRNLKHSLDRKSSARHTLPVSQTLCQKVLDTLSTESKRKTYNRISGDKNKDLWLELGEAVTEWTCSHSLRFT